MPMRSIARAPLKVDEFRPRAGAAQSSAAARRPPSTGQPPRWSGRRRRRQPGYHPVPHKRRRLHPTLDREVPQALIYIDRQPQRAHHLRLRLGLPRRNSPSPTRLPLLELRELLLAHLAGPDDNPVEPARWTTTTISGRPAAVLAQTARTTTPAASAGTGRRLGAPSACTTSKGSIPRRASSATVCRVPVAHPGGEDQPRPGRRAARVATPPELLGQWLIEQPGGSDDQHSSHSWLVPGQRSAATSSAVRASMLVTVNDAMARASDAGG
jgi:hypothetical protein